MLLVSVFVQLGKVQVQEPDSRVNSKNRDSGASYLRFERQQERRNPGKHDSEFVTAEQMAG